VSLPFTDDKRAMWMLLEGDEGGYRLERQFAAYDAAAVLARLDETNPPAAFVLREALA